MTLWISEHGFSKETNGKARKKRNCVEITEYGDKGVKRIGVEVLSVVMTYATALVEYGYTKKAQLKSYQIR